MIARVWRGRTRAEDIDAYAAYVRETGYTTLRANDANRGAMVLVRDDGDEGEILVISLWESMEDIRSFAGEDAERAVYYPEDRRWLLDMDPHVRHWRVVDLAVE